MSGIENAPPPFAAPSPGLDAVIRVRRQSFSLGVDLMVDAGRVLVILGPNGAGKSTVLQTIAGAVDLEAGHIKVAGRVLDDRSSHVREPTSTRHIGFVFQDYLLFPHLTVEHNVAFGLRASGMPRAEAHERAATWLDRFGISALAHRRPSEISGGQAQRVALARALATDPGVLLLDEPLAALDVEVRDDVRADLAVHLREFPGVTVVVTHSLADATALADEVIVLEAGRVTQRGTVADLQREPATPYVARLVRAAD